MTQEQEEKEIRAEQWIKQLRDIFTDMKIPMTYENEGFRLAERFFWMGLITGIGAESIPVSIQVWITTGRSPVMEYKVKRRRRKQTEPPDLLK
jgi:hypothetical protein